ncbi:DNA alkylation repair protein [uncultured Cedecea sp.]|uniref:DNA alkylation repair protein n=1 Tax=uncultured Cedecea sp. TaxID=988762 RepID=UPI00262EC105|nr:DNA alkylation repair protein [uncultured Cedecea sp.]
MSNITENSNENAFKHAFNEALLQQMAASISRYLPSFHSAAFLAIAPLLTDREMKARVHLIRDTLAAELPENYPDALNILISVLKDNQLRGFSVWPIAEFIQTYGIEYPDISLDALAIVTQFFTSEWAVRPFIKRYPQQTMMFLLDCARSENVDIRRWASEGTRPRVPWGELLPAFIQDPSATREILEALKFDPELYVRKSVANHLNDITKDNPDYVIQLLTRWKQQASPAGLKNIDWIIKQALRTLIKAGHPGALSLIGVQFGAKVELTEFTVKKRKIRLNESLEFTTQLRSLSDQPQNIVLDYILHFMKANNTTSPKVFKLRTFSLPPDSVIRIDKKHTIKKITTRQYYEGIQYIEIQVNGKVLHKEEWLLELAEATDDKTGKIN